MDRRPAIASFCGFSGSVIALIVLQILRPERSLRHSFVSEFAVGRYGVVMTVVFVILAMSSLLLEAAIRQAGDIPHRLCLLIRLTTVGLLVIAACRTDLNDASPRTLIGSIHNGVAVLTFVSAIGVMATIGYSHSISFPLARLQPISRSAAAICTLTLTMMLSVIGIQHAHRPYLYAGLIERVLIAAFLLWACLSSFELAQNRGETKVG